MIIDDLINNDLVEDDYRIIRGCGWIKNFGHLENRTCFQRSGTSNVMEFTCVFGKQ